MIIKVAEYTVKPDGIDFAADLVKQFVASVHASEPLTFYEAYRKGESMNFIHLMKFPNSPAEEQHIHAAYTQKFVSLLYPLCVQEPVFTELSSMG